MSGSWWTKSRSSREMEVQVNLTWGPFASLATTDVWLDAGSLDACLELQRKRHLRLIRSRFLPGWVDAVKNKDTGGGEVTVTLFGGMDPLLYQELKRTKHPRICDAENSLRTWGYHAEYAPSGPMGVVGRKRRNLPSAAVVFNCVCLFRRCSMASGPAVSVRLKGPVGRMFSCLMTNG